MPRVPPYPQKPRFPDDIPARPVLFTILARLATVLPTPKPEKAKEPAATRVNRPGRPDRIGSFRRARGGGRPPGFDDRQHFLGVKPQSAFGDVERCAAEAER